MDINTWLLEFKDGWTQHDIEKIMCLFTNTVEYWETPYKCLHTLKDVELEWQAINNQRDIELQTTEFSSDQNSHTVLWKLEYSDNDNLIQQWAGTYLIQINAEGKCFYFHQAGEKNR